MHILCCHTGSVQANCLAALHEYAPGTEFLDVSADARDYGRAIAERWNKGKTLILVEQDNEITLEVLPSFAECDEPWCTYAYEVFAPPWTRWCETGLGCVKFSISLQQDFPFGYRMLEEPCKECGALHDFWGALDFRLHFFLSTQLHLKPHVHGRIRHFHPYQVVDPDATDGPRAGAVVFKGEIWNSDNAYLAQH